MIFILSTKDDLPCIQWYLVSKRVQLGVSNGFVLPNNESTNTYIGILFDRPGTDFESRVVFRWSPVVSLVAAAQKVAATALGKSNHRFAIDLHLGCPFFKSVR